MSRGGWVGGHGGNRVQGWWGFWLLDFEQASACTWSYIQICHHPAPFQHHLAFTLVLVLTLMLVFMKAVCHTVKVDGVLIVVGGGGGTLVLCIYIA